MLDLFENSDKTSGEDKFLSDIRFALIGSFSLSKKELAERIVRAGGSDKITLSKNTRVVVKGEKPSENDLYKLKMLRHDGFHIPVITEREFMDILERRNISFHFPKVRKRLDIDYDFIVNPEYRCLVPVSYDGITHCLGCREIFINHIYDPKIHLYWQIIGNLAGVGVNVFDPYETNYIMLGRSTLESLLKGEKDDLILLIEKTYNSSKSEKFNYKFILEDEFWEFVRKRSEKVGDHITLDLIEKYESD